MGSKKKDENKQKTYEQMTIKELKEEGLKIEGITGVHGMNKNELIAVIKKAKGIQEDAPKKDSSTTRELKKKIKVLKGKQENLVTENNVKMSRIVKKRISRLKKRTRKAA